MRTIQVTKIELVNFKGIKNLCVECNQNTNIYGKNEAGKTTIFDGLIWGLFGKDSQDRKDFEIKTLDENNNVIEKIDHEVTITLLVNGEEIVLRKVLTEKWTKKKGSSKTEFTGNTIEHYWNGVPLGTAREYQEKVNDICDETVFKLITNPAAFMALKWQDRREALVKIADKITDKDLAVGNRDFEGLIFKLSNNKTLEEYAKEIQASIKKAKEDLKAIPTRIDEVVRSKTQGIDFKQVQNLLDVKNSELEEIEKSIINKSGLFDEELEKINQTKSKANDIRNWFQVEESVLKISAKKQIDDQNKEFEDLKAEISENEKTLQTSQNGIITLNNKLKLLDEEITATTKSIDEKREEWKKINAETLTFDEDCFDCPTCKRLLESIDIEAQKKKMQADFIAEKQINLAAISANAKQMQTVVESQKLEQEDIKNRIEKGKDFIANLTIHNTELEQKLEAETKNQVNKMTADDLYVVLLANCKLYHEKKAELKEIEATMKQIPQIDYSELTNRKKELIEEIAELNAKMHKKEQIKIADERIKKLQTEEDVLSQQILNVERTQFLIDNFNKVKTEHLENSINSKLKTVRFKMFEKQINGGESPICEAIYNGVPYSNVNTAGKLNVGLDIINMLCEYYQVSAPVIIDNRESVTDIIECNSQIINLIVSPEDETLRVETSKNQKEVILN